MPKLQNLYMFLSSSSGRLAASAGLSAALLTAILVPSLSVVVAAVAGRPAFAQQEKATSEKEEAMHVNFVSNIEMVKGHLTLAMADIEKGNKELAKEQVKESIDERYEAVLEPEIAEHDAKLNSTLKAALVDLESKSDAMAPADFKTAVANINNMLNQAVLEVISSSERNDTKFNAKVMISLVSKAGEEYGESVVAAGKIDKEFEYQIAQGFRVRANMLFSQSVASNLTAHEKDLAQGFFADLESSMNKVEDSAKIDSAVRGIVQEVKEGAGIVDEEDTGNSSIDAKDVASATIQYIQNTKQLLKQAAIEYNKGNSTGAAKLADTAYLDNFEHVEPVLVKNGNKELKEELENMMRVQLRVMIANGTSQDRVSNHINTINSRLDQAIQVVPEFPIGIATATTVAMASVIAAVMLVSRFRTAVGSFGNRTP